MSLKHTHAHTNTHTRTHTNTHAHILTLTRTHTNTHIHAHNTHIHTYDFINSTHLYNGIHRTGFLTKSTVDTFGHVDIISGCPTATILPLLGFNSDRLSTKTHQLKPPTMWSVQHHRHHTS